MAGEAGNVSWNGGKLNRAIMERDVRAQVSLRIVAEGARAASLVVTLVVTYAFKPKPQTAAHL